MQQVHALQEMVRSQPTDVKVSDEDAAEMKELQSALEVCQDALSKAEARVNEVIQEKTKIEQDLFRSHQEVQDLQRTMDTRVAVQSASLKSDLERTRSELEEARAKVISLILCEL